MTGFLLLLMIALSCGTLVQALAGFTRGGCLMSVIAAYLGAIAGHWLGHVLDLPYEPLRFRLEGRTFPIAWPIVGAALFPTILNLLLYRRRPVR
ncbi:MAG TPA: hypothetical protein VFW87_02265 [Pirellulales bacterium]|nr:hypothetical protein [Pirellulales bacterium]